MSIALEDLDWRLTLLHSFLMAMLHILVNRKIQTPFA